MTDEGSWSTVTKSGGKSGNQGKRKEEPPVSPRGASGQQWSNTGGGRGGGGRGGGRGGNSNNQNRQQKGGNNNNNKTNKSPLEEKIKEKAAAVLKCLPAAIQVFTNLEDPLNPPNRIDGAICRSEGPYYGTMLITHKNGNALSEPEIIFGTPKIEKVILDTAAPATTPSPTPAPSPLPNSPPFQAKYYYFANKWNGENITFFKYGATKDSKTPSISARPRGSFGFVKDTRVTPTLSTIKSILGLPADHPDTAPLLILDSLPPLLEPLTDPLVQSISFELCGTQVPELVKYPFPAALKPLFVTHTNGNIVPYLDGTLLNEESFKLLLAAKPSFPGEGASYDERLTYWTKDGPALPLSTPPTPTSPFPKEILEYSTKYSSAALEINNEHRKINNIPGVGYYYNNYALEGKVLYLLGNVAGAPGLVNNRVLYKVKPTDIDQSHIAMFDNFAQCRAVEALTKLRKRGGEVTEENVRKEMDLDVREWSFFSKDIMALLSTIPNNNNTNRPLSKQKMVILVGLPGAGKSTVANRMVQASAALAAAATATTEGAEEGATKKSPPLSLSAWYRVNQDEMKTRQACEQKAKEALRLGKSVIVDRCNFDIKQRSTWIKIADEYMVNDVRCLYLKTPADVCKSRVSVREDHPTIPKGSAGVVIIDRFQDQLVPPLLGEGFTFITTAETDAEIDAALATLVPLAQYQVKSNPTPKKALNSSAGSHSGGSSSGAMGEMKNPFALLEGGDGGEDEDDEEEDD